jgi:hypothetical protein
MWIFWLVVGVVVVILLKDKFTKKAGPPTKRDIEKALKNIKVTTTIIEDESRPSSSQDTDTDTDAWEGSFYDIAGPQRSAAKTVRLKYTDANGKQTDRVVNIRAFESSGSSALIFGHCHLRNANRTFRFDRMRKVVDEDTGEIITDLQKCLNDEWLATPQPVMDKLYEEHHDVLKLMLYMAKADGAVRAAELAVIARYCADITQDTRITVPMIKDMLQCVDVVSITTFVRTYNRLRRERPEAALMAAAACRDIVATQKTVHPNEQSALDALDKPLPALK